MPIATSIESRQKPRHQDSMFTQVRRAGKFIRGRFDLAQAFMVSRKMPSHDDAYFRRSKELHDQLIQVMLNAIIDHHLARMVLDAARSYGESIDELATEEEKRRFAVHLVNQRPTLIGEATIDTFSSVLLRTMNLKHSYGSPALADYIVKRFNDQLPLTENVMAVIDHHDVILVFVKTNGD